ncbi:protein SPO16 homolog isoform X2 [Dendropsophus ebraccatus]|uniref:protein SPO16 homolog isoform X2 n=1 Tax=Dendropsophus ebraccatus TaxID=150705 RepID=UPI003831C3F3
MLLLVDSAVWVGLNGHGAPHLCPHWRESQFIEALKPATRSANNGVSGHSSAGGLEHHSDRQQFSAGTAFLLVNTQEARGGEDRETFFDKIQQFSSTHRNSFIVMVAALHGPEEWDLMRNIQLRFLGSNLKVIPAHNSAETVKSVLTIVKATCKPHCETIEEKLLQAKVYIAENSPAWKALDEM